MAEQPFSGPGGITVDIVKTTGHPLRESRGGDGAECRAQGQWKECADLRNGHCDTPRFHFFYVLLIAQF
jgi:hypothetical protein